MRRGGFWFLAVLLASTPAIAQATTANKSQDGQNTATPPVSGQNSSQSRQTATVQGCLGPPSVADNTFTLTQDQTGIVYTLPGNTSVLKSHVGHEVRVTGQLIFNAANAASSNTPSSNNPSSAVPNRTARSAPKRLQVSEVQMVSDHCAGTNPATAPATSPDDVRSTTSENSPQTTTVLPLLGLLGLGSLIAGLIVPR
jgi:hypothetical protein